MRDDECAASGSVLAQANMLRLLLMCLCVSASLADRAALGRWRARGKAAASMAATTSPAQSLDPEAFYDLLRAGPRLPRLKPPGRPVPLQAACVWGSVVLAVRFAMMLLTGRTRTNPRCVRAITLLEVRICVYLCVILFVSRAPLAMEIVRLLARANHLTLANRLIALSPRCALAREAKPT